MREEYINNEEYDDEEDEKIYEEETRLVFRIIKGKVSKDAWKYPLILNQICPEVQYEGRTCLRVLTTSPVEFENTVKFFHDYLGDFPAKSPYIYIPKEVLVQKPKAPKKKKKLFKD